MHISIEADCRRGLRVIEEIPDIALCRLAGYNGIGKTNAIKLLRLCTGEQPFEGDDASWRTFRDQIVSARVHVTAIQGAEQIEWDLDPRNWPERAEIIGDRLGKVRIDGRDARLRDISNILRVYHILVAETPTDTLAGRALSAHKLIKDWLDSRGTQRQQNLDIALREVQDLIASCAPAQARGDISTAKEVEGAAVKLREQLQALRQRVELLEKSVETADQLDQVRGQGPEMDLKLAGLQGRFEEIENEKEQLDIRIADASARQHSDQQAEREFTNAQRYLIRHDKTLTEARSKLEELAAAADVSPQRDDLEATRKALGRKLNELVELQPQIHDTPLIVAVLEDLILRLDEAEQADLGEAVLIDSGEKTTAWTVTRFKVAFSDKMSALSNQAPPAAAEHLATEIAKVRAKLDALVQALDALNNVENAQVDVARAQSRLSNAVGGLPEATATTLNDLMNKRSDLDRESQSLQAQIAKLRFARDLLGGGRTEEALAADLLRLCREAQVDASKVRGRLQTEQKALDELKIREATAAQHARRAQRDVSQRTADLARVIEQLSTASDFEWVRRAEPSLTKLSSTTVERQIAAIEGLAVRLESARDQLQSAYSGIQGLDGALADLATQLRHPQDNNRSRENEWSKAAGLWLAGEVRDWFADDLIREALFEGGDAGELDLNNMTVSWTANGMPRQRALSTFSSGEKAFAYTQARVASIDREVNSTANRLIALDEFGAFMDGRRLSTLGNYLMERHSRVLTDQVLMILPYDGSNRGTRGGNDLESVRTRDLERRGYFAEEFQL